MKHNFCYKLIGMLPPTLLSKLQELVVRPGGYKITTDFHPDVIRIKAISPHQSTKEDLMIMSEFYEYMGKFFKLDGHMGTNVARMEPISYISEHDDYGAAIYGNRQDSIIKLQIPITTSDQVGMMWRGDKTYPPTAVHMVEGGVYIIDNVKVHSVVNMGSNRRYNLTSRWHLDSLIDPTLAD